MVAHKHNRQEAIARLVRTGRVATQRELIEALRRRKLPADQSTLSRDLAELGIRKVAGRYVLAHTEHVERGPRDHSSAVRAVVPCGPNLIVISTDTGAAQAVAVAIDQAAEPSIVGTLGGDDTIFVATRNGRTQVVALRRLQHWFGAKHEQG